MVGFKSFAERTVVEFGPGISAVVGPNGSGKSNLADALRWALGEQGRSLRTRRAEDLIFAGSSTRRAIGMADVTLVIDNGDRLLPVDYGEVELGRRLYRSGENEYLLNRQKIRLRDLVDLLDEANIADNAFLFIGQGMVDQALALRPEERRPLFEEAAGIRKHERRRRQAESELTEAESNLERVRDLLAELRPQARRLAAQAEQQEQRRNAGAELSAALVAAARSRLGDAEQEAARQGAALSAARRDADSALSALREAEGTAQALARALTERAEAETAARTRLDAARAATVEQKLAETRHLGEAQAVDRDRARVASERAGVVERIEAAQRAAALPVPEADGAAEEALRDAEQRLADAARQLAEARETTLAEGERETRTRQAREARREEVERAERLATEAGRVLARQEAAAAAAGRQAGELSASVGALLEAAGAAAAREAAAEGRLESAQTASAAAETSYAEAAREVTARTAELAAARARLASMEHLPGSGSDERTVRSARARGGRRIAEGLDVDPRLRLAVEAALGDALVGLAVDGATALALRESRATLLLSDAKPSVRAGQERDAARVREAATAAGGGLLTTALRRDPQGDVARLLARCVWVPELEGALSLRAALPPGWRVVTEAGEVVTDEGLVRVGRRESVLERRSASEELGRATGELEAAIAAANETLGHAEQARRTARTAVEKAKEELDAARRSRRIAEEQERAAARSSEAAAREAAWQLAQLERARAAAERAQSDVAALVETSGAAVAPGDGGGGPAQSSAARTEIAALDQRVRALKSVRDARAAEVGTAHARRSEAEERRRRAEIGLGLDTARLEELDREMARLVGADADLAVVRDRLAAELARASAEQAAAEATLAAVLASGTDERARLVATETAAAQARERLRAAELRSRAAEVAEMEVRLQFDAAREGLLVELAGIGPDGLAALRADPGGEAAAGTAETPSPVDEDLTPALEAALEAALAAWRASAQVAASVGPAAGPEQPPSPGRLGSLRRRYHELGVSNPFAAQEYAEVRARLETLDSQRADLESAIDSTRELIGTLNGLITRQFRQTFAALEGAFARRFRQLFDGGEAELSLTAPDDLSTTGVEITARPPGKKRQPLAMLSGGERALTAVALLLAMLEVRPVPFCVLDEVDAALDEANIGRFSSALRGLAESIQFIVITHNRGTIEAADALYGVTVGDDAVSHVVSLRLADRAAEPVAVHVPEAHAVATQASE